MGQRAGRVARADGAEDIDVTRNAATAGQGAIDIDGHRSAAAVRAVDHQGAIIDLGSATVGVGTSQGLGAGACLGQRDFALP